MQVLVEFAFSLVLFSLWFFLDRLRVKSIRLELKGWTELLWGVFFIFVGSIVDVSENLPFLSKFLIVGDTPFSAMAKVGFYILGIILVLLSPFNWLSALLERKMKDEDKERREKFVLSLASELKEKSTLSDLFTTALPEIIGYLGAQKGAIFLISGEELVLSSSSGFPKESVEGLKSLQIQDDAISSCAKQDKPQMVKSLSDSEKRLANLIADDKIKSLICAPLSSRGKILGVLSILSKNQFKIKDLLILSSLGKEIGEMIQCLNYETQVKIKSEKLDWVETQRKLLLDMCGAVSEPKTKRTLNRIVWTGVQMMHSDSCKILETDSKNKIATIIASSNSGMVGKEIDILKFPEIKEVMKKEEILFKTLETNERGIKSLLVLPLAIYDRTLGALVFEFKEYSPTSTEVEIDVAKSLANFTSFILYYQRLSEQGEKKLPLSFEFLDQLNKHWVEISEKTQLLSREIQNLRTDPDVISEELKNIEQIASKLSQVIRKIQGYPQAEEKIQKEEKEEAKPERLKILAIDDQKVIRDLLNDMVQSLGYEIELAEGGQQGLKIFEEDNFDMVIAELVMPEVSGWDVSRQVKRLKPDVLVILLTGWEIPPEEKMLKDYGVDFVLFKPFRLDQLGSIIKKAKEMKKVENH